MTGSDLQAVLAQLPPALTRRGRVALCQILRVEGATAGRRGWKLFVEPESAGAGGVVGNLGGGAFEAMVVETARRMLAESDRPDAEAPRSLVKRYYFTEEAMRGEATGMVCGGMAEVLIERIEARPVLVVCGGGPVGQAVARAADLCDFDLLIADDRETFRAPELFPDGAALAEVGADYAEPFLDGYGERELWVTLVTRCWETDAAALAALVRQRPERLRYLGLLGSRRKVTRVLEAAGDLPPEWPVRGPVGLPIGGETPGEIAVSILAEMIEMRRDGAGRLAAGEADEVRNAG